MKNLYFYFIFLSVGVSLSAQEPGDLYIDFGTAGIFKERWPGAITEANDIGILQDGSIVLSGYLETTLDELQHILAVKLDNHGVPREFGNSIYGFECAVVGDEKAYAVQVLPDGKILIAGYYYAEGHYHPLAIRLFPDGQPDEEFGNHGIFNGEVYYMDVMDIDIYRTGGSYAIVLCGQSGDMTGRMLMLNDEGGVEDEFGNHGIVNLETGGEGTFSRIDIDSENHCLYACAYYSDGSIIAKYHLPDGELCPEFGNSGILIYGPSEGFSGKVNAINHDSEEGRIVLFGEYNHVDGDKDIFACCLNADDGSLHLSFGAGGWTSLRSATSKDYLSAAIRQSDGKYYIGGYTNLTGDYDFFIGRVNPNGFADNTFGINGLVLTDMGGRNFINALALSPEEDVLYAAGLYEETPGDDAMAVAAYHTGYVSESGLGLQESATEPVHAFPNPVTDHLLLKVKHPRDLSSSYQLFDNCGRMLISEKVMGNECTIPMEQQASGIYFLKVMTRGKVVRTIKIIKK